MNGNATFGTFSEMWERYFIHTIGCWDYTITQLHHSSINIAHYNVWLWRSPFIFFCGFWLKEAQPQQSNNRNLLSLWVHFKCRAHPICKTYWFKIWQLSNKQSCFFLVVPDLRFHLGLADLVWDMVFPSVFCFHTLLKVLKLAQFDWSRHCASRFRCQQMRRHHGHTQ